MRKTARKTAKCQPGLGVRRSRRRDRAVYLVELLVAMMLGAMLTFALLQTASISLRHASSTQNEVYANTIVRELMESTRTANYDELAAAIGEHTLLTNRTSAGQTGPSIRTEPLQLDTVNKTWEFPSENSRFRGEVRYRIENGPVIDSLRVTAIVSWMDSTKYDSSAGKRTVTASTIVSRLGSGAWNQ